MNPHVFFVLSIMIRDRSQTLVGEPDAKISIVKIFRAPPSARKKKKKKKKKKIRAPLFAMKITGQPHRKACRLNF